MKSEKSVGHATNLVTASQAHNVAVDAEGAPYYVRLNDTS